MHWKMKAMIGTLMISAAAWTCSAAEVPENWTKECAKCHGKEGKGDTTMGKKLKAKDYTDAAVQAKMTDPEMTKSIKAGVKDDDGKTRMKAFDKLSDDEVKDLVAFIRTLKK
jgi:cytochrome c6